MEAGCWGWDVGSIMSSICFVAIEIESGDRYWGLVGCVFGDCRKREGYDYEDNGKER
jgi:hypothetical protein